MLRLRRYRVFLIFAIIALAFLYHFTNVRDWETSSRVSVDSLRKLGHNEVGDVSNGSPPAHEAEPPAAAPPPAHDPPAADIETSANAVEILATGEATVASISKTVIDGTATKPADAEETGASEYYKFVPPAKVNQEEEFGQTGQGRLEVENVENAPPRLHWIKPEEHFPVPSESLIHLPTGTPKKIPKIQHVFAEETADKKRDRERKLASIKEAFETTWKSYKQYAWMHDELSPVSGGSRDPFCGWAASLVDTLDSLWIMGLKEEFEAATDAVKTIDFTVSVRKDIPLFETVIRYLGGLIAAYDLSGGEYDVLLEKALELAEILMGAFDTPNRMPDTFYYWAPSYTSQPHRAKTRVVLAELGSLSVEFTRLAQITNESKYYDAVARVTDELEKWQMNTKLPGMWPLSVDASGCKKPEVSQVQMRHSALNGPQEPVGYAPAHKKPDSKLTEESDSESTTKTQSGSGSKDDADSGAGSRGRTREFESATNPQSGTSRRGSRQPRRRDAVTDTDNVKDKADCEPQGLASPPSATYETFSLGGQSDSTYEYLPKEYLLLGGLKDQYRTMYENAMDTVRKYLLFRPMTQNRRNVLVSGKVKTKGHPDADDDEESDLTVTYEHTHLTCFAGGMFALGSKIFGIESDMDVASKLTDGCVWAYESTQTGIMPEGFQVIPCTNPKRCEWNETLWWERLDPLRQYRERQWHEQEALYQSQATSVGGTTESTTESEMTVEQSDSSDGRTTDSSRKLTVGQSGSKSGPDSGSGAASVVKRQPSAQLDKKSADSGDVSARKMTTTTATEDLRDDEEPAVAPPAGARPHEDDTDASPIFTPPRMPTHEEYVQTRISEERIPPGFTEFNSRKYILRPEAIESVFIMFRLTGDEYWREKGWKMFTAIQSYTRTPLGNSAINDVTSEVPVLLDEMESFWLAETLKYFYLLFSDPSVVSLDDYVLNTEAHAFKMPSSS